MTLAQHIFHVQRPNLAGEQANHPSRNCSPVAALACFGGGGGSSAQSTTSAQTNTSLADSYNKTKSVYKTSKKVNKNSGNVDNSVKNITKNVTMTGNTGGLDTLASLGKKTVKDDYTSGVKKKNKKGGGGFKLTPKTLLIGGGILLAAIFLWRKLR